jgi:polyhydroxybutyrate depolymerase
MKPWLRRPWKPNPASGSGSLCVLAPPIRIRLVGNLTRSPVPVLIAAIALAGCGGSSGGSSDSLPTEPASCEGKTGAAGSFVQTIESGGLERTFRLAVPEGLDRTRPVPLVLNFHGLGSNAQAQEVYAGMAAKAAEEGFITAAGQGTGNSWNTGQVCCAPANQEGVDDVQFVRDMVAAIALDYCIDPARIYATGMSNGGFMSNRLACEAADLIAAVAPVASFLGFRDCAPSRPIPILMFNGTDDALVPYGAASGAYSAWGELNGCGGAPEGVFANGDSSCLSYPECADGATTTFCTVEGGGHTWPGAIAIPGLGFTTTDLDATDAMWDFFVAHPKP